MEWYYTKDGQQVGPVTQDELIRLISVGQVSSNQMAWHEGLSDWQLISNFAELQVVSNVAKASPPPISASPRPSAAPSPLPSASPSQSPSPSPYSSSSASPAPSPSAYPQPVAPPKKTSGLAIASLCLGPGGFMLCGVFAAVLAIPGIICGHMALAEIKRSKDQIEGKPLAIIGLVISYLIVLASLIILLVFGVIMTRAATSGDWDDSHQVDPFWDQTHGVPDLHQPDIEDRVPDLLPDPAD